MVSLHDIKSSRDVRVVELVLVLLLYGMEVLRYFDDEYTDFHNSLFGPACMFLLVEEIVHYEESLHLHPGDKPKPVNKLRLTRHELWRLKVAQMFELVTGVVLASRTASKLIDDGKVDHIIQMGLVGTICATVAFRLYRTHDAKPSGVQDNVDRKTLIEDK